MSHPALITITLAGVFLGERLTHGKLTALVLGVFGVILMLSPSLNTTDNSGVLGLMLVLAASVGSASGSVIIKTMHSERHLFTITAWQLILGSLPPFAGSLAFERGTGAIWSGEFLGLYWGRIVAYTTSSQLFTATIRSISSRKESCLVC